jgi:hypothetical protein
MEQKDTAMVNSCSLLKLGHSFLLSFHISTPGFQAFDVGLNYTPSFSDSVACRWQIMGLFDLHNHMSQLT